MTKVNRAVYSLLFLALAALACASEATPTAAPERQQQQDVLTATDTPSPIPPTEIPPTETPTPAPTNTPAPTASPTIAGPSVVIVSVDKGAEYVDLRNVGSEPQDLAGWLLLSEKGGQRCDLAGILQPGATLRIWARAIDADKEGFNCGHQENIWNNSDLDRAILYDAQGAEVDTRP